MMRHRVLLAASVASLVIGCCGCGPSASSPGRDASAAGADGTGTGAGGAGGASDDVSRTWTWQACGSLSPGPAATSARFSPDGRQAFVRDEDGGVTLYDNAGSAPPMPLGRVAGPVLYAPDGTLLARAADDGPHIVLRPLSGATTPSYSFELPAAKAFCDYDRIGFSASGDYLLTLGDGISCVWRTVDGSLITAFVSAAQQTAVNGETLITLMPDVTSDKSAEVVTFDFSGRELGHTPLEGEVEPIEDLVLSPVGDRVAGSSTGRLWDAASGAEILPKTYPRVMPAVFGSTGEFVLVADGVFRTQDGARVATTPDRNRLQVVFDLAPDGHLALSNQIGNVAALSDVSSSGVLRILGAQTAKPGGSDSTGTPSLEISEDGGILVAGARESEPSFAFRVAPRFEDSEPLLSMRPWIATLSGDGRFAASAGDVRTVYDITDGAFLWYGPGPPLQEISCWGTRLRPSPSGRWAAGAGYGRKIDVFSLAPDTSGGAKEPIVSLHGGCFDSAAFTRDERLMATSEPALFRTGSAPEDWQLVWQHNGSSLGNGGVNGGENGTFNNTFSSTNDVTFSPDETRLLVSRCDYGMCDARLYDVADVTPPVMLPELRAPHPSFSPDGHWIVAGGTLLHLPSGQVHALDAASLPSVAVFAPNGDIIAIDAGEIITRYCRTP
jgi:WD40 repeat protein